MLLTYDSISDVVNVMVTDNVMLLLLLCSVILCYGDILGVKHHVTSPPQIPGSSMFHFPKLLKLPDTVPMVKANKCVFNDTDMP